MKFYDKKPRELEQNLFTLPDNPAVIAAGENGDAVSAPQGAFGVFAGRPCAFLFLPRDSRVCALLEAGKPCSISFFDTPAFRDSLNALARYGTLDAGRPDRRPGGGDPLLRGGGHRLPLPQRVHARSGGAGKGDRPLLLRDHQDAAQAAGL